MKKIILIGAASTVAIAGSVGAFLAFDKTPKEMYFLAEMAQIESTAEQFEKDFSKEFDLYRSLLEESYKTTENMTFGIDSESLKNSNPELHNFLNDLQLNVAAQQDTKNDKMSLNLDVVNKNEYVVGMDAVLSSKQMAVKLPGILENYLYLNTADYGKFMKNQNLEYNGSDSLEFSPTKNTPYQLDEKLVSDLRKDYGMFIYDAIREENITLENVEVDGRKAKELTFTITEGEMKSISEKVLTKLKSDEDMVDRLSQSLVDYYGSSLSIDSLLAEEEMSKDTFKEEILTAIDSSLTALKEPSPETSNVLLTSKITVVKDEIIDRQLTLTNDKGAMMALTHEKNDKGGKMKIVRTDSNEKGSATKEEIFTDTYIFERDKNGFTTNHNFKFGTEGEDSLKLRLDMERSVHGDDAKTKLILTDQNSFTITSDSAYKMTEKSMEGTSEVSIDIEGVAEIAISSISDTVITDELDFTEIDEKKDVNLATLKEARKMELLSEAQTKAMTLYMKYAELFMPSEPEFTYEEE